MKQEEAIERIKARFDKWALDNEDIKAIQALIPELRENEDERIRKALIEGVRQIRCKNGITQEQMVAYLEKQKETGIQWFKSDNVKNPDKPYIDKAGMFYTTDGRMCYASEIEKQKEEEGYEAIPVESTLEYKLGFKAGKDSEKQKKQKPLKIGENAYFDPNTDMWFIKKEQKPIKWTDLTWKDIIELEGIINNVHYDFSDGIGQESFGKEVLERFRSTKGIEYLDEAEQKYWREEGQKEQKLNPDKEKLIKHCIGLILIEATDERFKDYGLTLKDCLTWLGEQSVTNDEQQECPYKDLALVKNFFGVYKRKCKLSNKACDSKECEQWNELQDEFKRINEAFEDGKNEVINHPEAFGLQKPADDVSKEECV